MAKITREKFKTYENVFDKFTVRNLFVLSSNGYLDEESLSPLSIGKEANVFQATRGNAKVALKIYRLEACDFTRMYEYIRHDPRYVHLKKRRREIIFAWAKREYRNLLAARKAEVNAPIPLVSKANILVMELIGQPAQKLKDAMPEDKKEFLEKVVENIKRFYKSGYVHGDLSAFNILNHNETPYFIDFSQAQSNKAPNADEILKRDIRNVCSFFRKAGVKAREERILRNIVENNAVSS